MIERGNHYHAFLLRLWRENEESPWRIILQDSRTGDRFSFKDLDKLTAYLQDKTEGRVLDLSVPKRL